ncbi:MAG: long-chain fatty acid--CoA ligase [Actinomycetales bacterium]|nr:long-chain fatty acid--CoA ligase [Actinomycetales bacterium]
MLNQGLGSWVHRRLQKSGDKPATIFQDRVTTYRQLDERINRLAHALQGLGITSGSRVGYLGENHPSFLETFFATTTLGAIFVPVNTRLAGPEINFILKDSGVQVIVVSNELASLTLASLEDTSVTTLVRLAQFDTLVAEGTPEFIDIDIALDSPAVIMYTSGTTGQPKGALLTHENLTWNALNVLVDYDIVSTDVSLMISPLFHSAAFGMGLLPAILKGATLLLEAGFEPGRVLHLIEKYKASVISGVPTTYQMLCEHPDWETTDISSLEKLTCGGSSVPLRVIEAYEKRGLSFTGGYGMTETSPGATSLQPAHARAKAGSAGLPHFFTAMRIVTDDQQIAAVGEIGEIQLRGPNVIAEYWNRRESSTDAFSDSEWFRSGDMGYVDDDGFLFVADRLKDMIISGGENIYPAEIEQIIIELPEVSAVAVIGVAHEKWGEAPVAVITLQPGAMLDAESVRAHLDGRLARFKIPRRVEFIAEMPRTASGKIRKADLRALYRD